MVQDSSQASLAAQAAQLRQLLSSDPGHANGWNELGLIELQLGRFEQAVSAFQQAIARKSDHAETHHDLGEALASLGRLAESQEAYRKSLSLRPNSAQTWLALAKICHMQQRWQEAVDAYHHCIAIEPRWTTAHHWLGSAYLAAGRFEDAAASFQRAIALNPGFADAYCDLGVALKAMGQLPQAIAALRTAQSIKPDLPQAHNCLGDCLLAGGDVEGAEQCFRRAIQIKPDYADAYTNLASALLQKGDLDGSVAASRRAVELRPRGAAAQYNHGCVLLARHEPEPAIAAFREALSIQPNLAEAHDNIALALKELMLIEQAIAEARLALSLRPDDARMHYNLARHLLMSGRFEEGWSEHEWRWRCEDLAPRTRFSQPMWDGAPLAGRSILVHHEQGFGDAIQFARYLPLLTRLGADRVLFHCPKELVHLFEKNLPGVQIIPGDARPGGFDVWCLLLSLPHLCREPGNAMPEKVPYIQTAPDLARTWSTRLKSWSGMKKVGIAWAGRSTPDPHRSIPQGLLSPLFEMSDIAFVSLQKEIPHSITDHPWPTRVLNWSAELNDFADTAALMANLDLVITIDTAVAHLAGAMGKPTWVLLPFSPDWRWLIDRADSPWYPSMKLFRQTHRGDWSQPLARVKEALQVYKSGAV